MVIPIRQADLKVGKILGYSTLGNSNINHLDSGNVYIGRVERVMVDDEMVEGLFFSTRSIKQKLETQNLKFTLSNINHFFDNIPFELSGTDIDSMDEWHRYGFLIDEFLEVEYKTYKVGGVEYI
jgi:hypothetical protein